MAFHYITLGRCNLSALLLTFLLCLSTKGIVAQTAPPDVTDVTVTDITEHSFNVSWTPLLNSANITYYIIIEHETTKVNKTTLNHSYRVTDLLPGTIYTVVIFAANDNGTSINGARRNATTLPSPAQNLTVTAKSDNSVTLHWVTPSSDNNNYLYTVTVDGGVSNVTRITTNFTEITSLTAGTDYNFTVFAVTQNEVYSKPSNVVNATTMPSPAQNLTVTAKSDNSVTLHWVNSPGPNNNSYTYTVDYGARNITGIKDNSAEITNLIAGTDYNFIVYAVTQNEVYSKPSNVISVTTLPSRVQDLTVTDVSENSLILHWVNSSDPNNDSYTYTVDYGGHNITGIRTNFAQITNLTAGTGYKFTVYAVIKNDVYSKPSDVVNVTTLPSPAQDLTVTAKSDNSVTLHWVISPGPNNNSYTYTVDYGAHNITGINNNSAEITNLIAGTDYNFTVYAVTQNDVYSKPSNVANATTMPSPVQNLKETFVSNNSVTLNWTISPGPENGSYTYTVDDGKSLKITDIKENFKEINNLTAGTEYNFTVFAVTHNGVYSRPSNVTSVTTQPSPVMGLNVSLVSNSSVTLIWMYSSDPHYTSYTYTVEDGVGNKIKDIKQNSTEIKNLTPGTNYNFTVFAVTMSGRSSNPSNVVKATTQPNIVQGVKEVNVTETTVTLQWDFSEDKNNRTYTYTVDGTGKNFTKISNVKANSVTVGNLLPGVNYNLSVFAVTDNDIYSQSSKSISVTTMPNAPINIQVRAVSISELYIEWTAPNDVNKAFYDYSVTWQDTKTLQNGSNTTTNNTHLSIQKLLSGHTYEIDVASMIQSTKSVKSSAYGVTQSVSVSNLTFNNVNNNSVTLLWSLPTYPDSIVTGYRVTVNPDDPDPANNLRCSKVDAYQIKVNFGCPDGNYSTFKVLVNENPKVQSDKCSSDVIISNLQPAASYKISVMTVATDRSAVTEAIICETDNIGVIVGSIFGILLFFLLIAVIVYLVLKKRKERGKDPDQYIPTTLKRKRFHTIPRDKFSQHYASKHSDSDFGFAEEYQELSSVGTTQAKRSAEMPENRAKNRFTNVLPYDHSRVKLSVMDGVPTSDYINANYIPGYNSTKEFIASQGPLPTTTADFWRMVWEHQVNTIIMLTNCMESGRIKCEHYWPLDYTPCTYGDITVTVTSETILSEWTVRDFAVKHANQPGIKYVRHFHFTAWPDHGVPDSTSSIIKFRNLVREHMDQRKSTGPTIVHCSAGVGRTGTLIALDYLMQQIEKEQRIGVYGFVEKMRLNRNLMVQTEAQYIFLNKCVLDLINQPMEENIYENHTPNELVYENVNAIRQHQRENA
ncbi:receptor-type tyrosine-protein phosphatase H isoform 2-T2 [Leptodactylus fuscus]|uniref:receptor-type tyrosine-protein phosphatase H isoform X2 n=1 Tax=Leptodactylus fuscus TaxID=238119 RepID=UPI003F4ECAE6